MKQKKLISSAIFSIVLASLCTISPSFAEETKENNNTSLNEEKIQMIDDKKDEVQTNEEFTLRKKKSNKITDFETNYKGVGFTAGLLSGAGFTYREFTGDKFGYKATGIYFFDSYSSYWDIGLQGMWVVHEIDWLRLYLLGGISNFGTKRYNDYSYPVPASSSNDEYVYVPSKNTYSNWDMYNNIGVGLGIEFWRQNNGVSLALELPLVLSFKNLKLNSLYPIPQISLIYNF